MRHGEMKDRADLEPEDKFLEEDDLYDRSSAGDLSDDPMMAPENSKPRGRKARIEARKAHKYAAYMERERETIKAEILAEIEAERSGVMADIQDGDGRDRVGGTRYAERGEEDAKGSRGGHSRLSEYIMSLLSGNILSRSEVRRVYPYLLFLSCLAFIYIANVFNMQQLYHKQANLTEQVKELRAKSMTIASKRMSATRQSYIISEIERRGLPLRESLSPNKVIKE